MINKIKNFIISEYEYPFTVEGVTFNKNFNDGVEIFIKTLTYKTDVDEFNGLEEKIFSSLRTLTESTDKLNLLAVLQQLALNLEPYLKKILYLTNRTAYDSIPSTQRGLSKYIRGLNLNKINFPLNPTLKQTILNYSTEKKFQYHLAKSYLIRNIEGHEAQLWRVSELITGIESIVLVYLFACFENIAELDNILRGLTISSYLRDIVNTFKQWQDKHIALNIKEETQKFDLYIEELVDNDVDEEVREGNLLDLRKIITENAIVLLGEAGSGKTTSIQYLAFSDAVNCLNNQPDQSVYPVYIQLKIINKDYGVLDHIINKMGLEKNDVIRLLKEGKFSIYIDGLNEIDKTLIKKIYDEISQLLILYNRNHFIITSRPSAYNRNFDDSTLNLKIPVFVLARLNNLQVENYLLINCDDFELRDKILGELKHNSALLRVVRIPLFLRMLVLIMNTKFTNLPESRTLIVKRFISTLLLREKKEKNPEFEVDIAMILLEHLAHSIRSMSGANVSQNKNEVIIPLLNEKMFELGTKINLFDFLTHMVDINILIHEKENYSFSHEVIQEYFIAEEIYANRKKINMVEYYSNPAWNDIVVMFSGLLSKEERESLILSIANSDLFLASKCKSISFNTEENIQQYLKEKAIDEFTGQSSPGQFQTSFLSLLELEEYNIIIDNFSKIRGSKIPLAVTAVESIIENTSAENLKQTILIILTTKAEYYIGAVVRGLSRRKLNSDFYLELRNQIEQLIKNYPENKVKVKYLINFLQMVGYTKNYFDLDLYKIISDFFLDLTNLDTNKLIYDYGYTEQFDITSKLNLLLSSNRQKIALVFYYFLVDNFVNLKNSDLEKIILSKDSKKNISLLYFITSNKIEKKISAELLSKIFQIIPKSFFNQNKDKFHSKSVQVSINSLIFLYEERQFWLSPKTVIGELVTLTIIHDNVKSFTLRSKYPGIHKIPKAEIIKDRCGIGSEIGVKVVFVDKMNQIIYYSQREVPTNENYFMNFNDIDIGQPIECQIVKTLEGKVIIRPINKSLGKHYRFSLLNLNFFKDKLINKKTYLFKVSAITKDKRVLLNYFT